MGINISSSRLGSTMNSYLSTELYRIYNDIFIPFLAGFYALIISFMLAMVVIIIDYRCE